MTTEENKMKKAVITSGYFNPIHIGHIEYLKLSKKGMDKLFVIVNNDIQRELKGSKKFMNQTERVTIVSEIKPVDFVFLSIDNDSTVRKTITHIYNKYHKEYEFFFANGGDQMNNTIPESKTCNNLGIRLLFEMGDKIQSSSNLLKNI